ncbi:hypothetical protein KA005_65360, partial [bacterium]|nr:hypothetical protein [bacterium]
MQLKQAIPFLGGLNRDDDPRLLPEGDYPYLKNARTGSPDEQQDEGLVVSLKSATHITKGAVESNTTNHIGVAVDMETQRSYIMIHDSTNNTLRIHEYDSADDTYSEILQVSASIWGITSLTVFINPRVVHGNLILTDDMNPPRMINIERARTSLNTGVGYFTGEKPGLWDVATAYSTDDFVYYIDRFYQALQATTG